MKDDRGGCEPISALLQRYRTYDDEPSEVHRASLAEALRGGTDPLKVLEYMRGLGLEVLELGDLLNINDDETEEELHAFPVLEGVAVSVASDGAWVLFTP